MDGASVEGARVRRRALLIKFGAIGDVVMLIPAAHSLFQAGYEIDWVCGRAVEPVLACYPWIRTIVADDRAILTGGTAAKMVALVALWRRLAGRKYDLCATLYYDERYRMLALPVRAKRKLMLSWTDRERRLLPGRHHTDEYVRILFDEPDGVKTRSLGPLRAQVLPVSPMPRVAGKKRVVLVPAGAKNMLRDDSLRRWPVESYAALARVLLQEGMDVVLLGGPGDEWALKAFDGLAVTSAVGKLSLAESVALLEDSDVLVTHDTGPLHLGGITGVGIVSIFGPTDPRYFHPRRAGTVAIWGGEGFACRPCYDGRGYPACAENACVRQVTPEMVLGQVRTMLDERAQGIARAPGVLTPVSTVVEERA